MTKEQAISRWGAEAVELARDYYETDFFKILFIEDCQIDDHPASDDDVYERCSRAFYTLQKKGI